MTSIGWIDFSSEHRDKVRTVIDLLKKQGVVDELGIGVIRDSFADRMFPGISTIQTRAKYFTLTALLVREYERRTERQKAKETLEEYLAREETWCRIKFAERYGSQGEARGIIGITFGQRRDRGVQRPASSVYWNGLRTFGIVRTRMSLAEFSRDISGRRSLKAILAGTDHLKGDDLDADADDGARVRVPEVDADYWDNLSITMTATEAEFLRQQITACVPDSLLGQIILDDDATAQLLKLKRVASFADMAELPFIRQLKREELCKTVYHARDFWTILEGSHIRYNRLLQSRFGSAQGVAACDEYWETWLDEMREFDWSTWESDFVWQLVEQHGSTVQTPTKRFVDGWISQARAGATDIKACDQLVIDQERANKTSRARLRPNNKDEHADGWIGLSELDYRLPQVRTIVEDIQRGESEEADPNVGR